MSVVIRTSGWLGDSVHVTIPLANLGTAPIASGWQASLYLSADTAISATDVLR